MVAAMARRTPRREWIAFLSLLATTVALTAPRPVEFVKQHQPALWGRRLALLHAGAAAGVALLVPLRSDASDGGGVATFTAGDPRFLQPAFDEIKYLGVQGSEVGTVDVDGVLLPAIRVRFDTNKVRYKRIVGAFLRAIDPTAEKSQFGVPGSSIIWVSNEEERAEAAGAVRRLDASRLFKRPIATEVRLQVDTQAGVAALGWMAAPEADQSWYLKEPQAYAKARSQTGRAAWFEQAYRPIKTTACDGAVCGYVIFPCSDENGCLSVMNGSW